MISDVNVYVGWVREHKEANLRYGNCQPNNCYMKFVYEAPMICFFFVLFFNSSGFQLGENGNHIQLIRSNSV